MLCSIEFLYIFASLSQFGVLAHLARVRHWQCRGDRFESDMLHHLKVSDSKGFR